MVWFQCEDCGENLKKPKLPNHFRICSAGKLSCIDCGVVFSQQNVQAHTQCVSEAEKYGPKGDGAVNNASTTKQKHQKQESIGIDLSMGLSTRAPWACSLCNVKATSQEALVLHSQGKKHRSKSRAVSSKLTETPRIELIRNCHGVYATEEMKASVLPRDSSDLTEFNTDGTRKHELRRGITPSSLEPKGIVKHDSGKHEQCLHHDEARPGNVEIELNNFFPSGFGNLEINSEDQEVGRERKRRKEVADECLKLVGVEKHSSKRKRKSEIAGTCSAKKDEKSMQRSVETGRDESFKPKQRCKVDLDIDERVNGNVQEEAGEVNGKTCSSKVSSFAQEPSETVLDTKSKSTNAESNGVSSRCKSKRKKADEQLEFMNHEHSCLSLYEQGKSSGGEAGQMLKPQAMRKGVDSFECSADRQGQHILSENLSMVVKWKKLIKKALKKAPSGSLKIKQLRKSVLPFVVKSIEAAGISVDEASLRNELDKQIHSCQKLILDGKKVRLANCESTN